MNVDQIPPKALVARHNQLLRFKSNGQPLGRSQGAPNIRPVRVQLDAIRPPNAYGWIFPNRVGGALDLANFAERVIKPVFKARGLDWKGWHAYRRGHATILKKPSVPDTTIQAILRHESVSTPQRFYLKTVREDAMDAMKGFEEKLKGAAVVQQMVN